MKIISNYEYSWGDDPCDITTDIAEKLNLESILQVAGSGDHLLSFCTLPSVKKITAFDIDERALAFTELKISAIKHLDFDALCGFFNMSQYRNMIAGQHNHPILDPRKMLSSEEFKMIYETVWATLSPRAKKLINVKLYDQCGFHSFASFKSDSRLVNPSVLPWLQSEKYDLLRGNLESITLYQASLDPNYGTYINDLMNGNQFDLVWPINALDHGVDFLPFLNFCTQNTRVGGYVMVLFGVKDPYISLEEAFSDIVNRPNEDYVKKMSRIPQKPTWNIYIGDIFEALGFELEKDRLVEISKKYFPRPENVWWDDDIAEAWSHRPNDGVFNILFLYRKTKETNPLSSEKFLELVEELPRYFKRGLVTSRDIEKQYSDKILAKKHL